jgi:hypothetical protein
VYGRRAIGGEWHCPEAGDEPLARGGRPEPLSPCPAAPPHPAQQQPFDAVRRHRPREVISLPQGASQADQGGALLLDLHPLGDGPQLQGVAQPDDGASADFSTPAPTSSMKGLAILRMSIGKRRR